MLILVLGISLFSVNKITFFFNCYFYSTSFERLFALHPAALPQTSMNTKHCENTKRVFFK